MQAFIASPPTGARGKRARRDGAKGHDNSAGAKEVMSVQYARVDGVLRGGAPPPVRRDARGQREQQRRAKPVVRTASDRRQPVLRPLEFTKLWSSRRMYRASKCSAVTKTLKIATINMPGMNLLNIHARDKVAGCKKGKMAIGGDLGSCRG